MKTLGYYNGKIAEVTDLDVSACDRGVYFGDGVYDAVYSHNYVAVALREHIERFFFCAEALEIQISFTKEQLRKLIVELVQKMDGGDNFVYFQATRGSALRNHRFLHNMQSNILITIKPMFIKDYKKLLKCITVPDTRHALCNYKTLNLLSNVLAATRAEDEGADEAIFIKDGYITECSHSNIMILKDDILVTCPSDSRILKGVQRTHLILLAKSIGIVVEERNFDKNEMMTADEVIVCSAGYLCSFVNTIDNIAVGRKGGVAADILQSQAVEEFYRETGDDI